MPANPEPERSRSAAESAALLRGALVERARIITLNTRAYECDVSTEFTFKKKFNIPFMSPYCHQAGGEGMNVMPEVGAMCWICTPSEQGRDAFILGFTMVDEGGAHRGGRELLNPGDMHFSTRDGNFVALRRGGIVQIGSTPICQRVYLPIRNVIQDFAENYELQTPAGELTWRVLRSEDDGEGHQQCLFSLGFKEFADDPNENTVGLLKLGSHGEGNDTILSLLTRDKGGGTKQVQATVNKSGEVALSMKKLNISVEGDLELLVEGKASINVDGPVTIETLAALQATADSVSLKAGNASLSLDGSAKLNGSQVLLGTATFRAVANSPDFQTWVAGVSSFTGVPAPVNHISRKVKV